MTDTVPQLSGISPYLHIKGGKARQAIDFYKTAFAAKEDGVHLADDGKRVMNALIWINGNTLMLSDEFPEMMQSKVREIGGFDLHLQVDNADTWFNRAVEAGCEVRMPLADQFWGDRYGSVRDPFGVDWSIASTIQK
jgi:PhnB protein